MNKIKNVISKHMDYSYLVPFISGASALFLLSKIIFSDLGAQKYLIAIVSLVVIFAISSFLFYLLKKCEKEKDQYLLSTVGKIVEDIFKHYGVAMASHAAGPTTAKEMNPIMQTIVNLVYELRELVNKTYTK